MIRLGMFLPPLPDRRWKLAAQAGVRYAVCRMNPAFDPFSIYSMYERFLAESLGSRCVHG